MIKKIFVLALASFPFFGMAQKQTYTVKGIIEGARDGMKVTMKSQGPSAIPVDDSARIKNGTFTLTGSVQSPVLVQLIIDKTPDGEKSTPNNWLASNFYLENSDITYKGNIETLPAYYYKRTKQYTPPVITGSHIQDENVSFSEGINTIRKEMQQVDAEYIKVYHIPAMDGIFHTEEGIALANRYDSLNRRSLEYTFEYIHEHPESRIAYDQASYMLAGYTTTLSIPEIDDVVARISKAWKGNPILEPFLESAEKARKTALGVKYQDFEFLNPEGKKVMLSSVVPEGKVVLLEFWASWCGPCRAEIPHLKHLHETKSDDFTIVSISLDEDDTSWRKAMKEEGMIWPQLVDYKGFEGDIAKAYNIFGIPHSLLLDREGRIIKVGLRGAFLDAYLQKLGVK